MDEEKSSHVERSTINFSGKKSSFKYLFQKQSREKYTGILDGYNNWPHVLVTGAQWLRIPIFMPSKHRHPETLSPFLVSPARVPSTRTPEKVSYGSPGGERAGYASIKDDDAKSNQHPVVTDRNVPPHDAHQAQKYSAAGNKFTSLRLSAAASALLPNWP